MRPTIILAAALAGAAPAVAQIPGAQAPGAQAPGAQAPVAQAAQPGAPPASSSRGSTAVSGVTVEVKRKPTQVEGVEIVANWCPKPDPVRHPATSPPRVVSTYPADGSVIVPGILMLRITFDRPMSCSWAVDYQSKGDEPCQPDGSWSLPDRRTWQVRCNVRGRSQYRIQFGEEGDGVRFTAQSGLEAPVYDLEFSTTDARPFHSVAERAAVDPAARRTEVAAGYIVCHDDSENEHARCIHVSEAQAENAAIH